MGFQWLEMRIAEEQDRRNRETHILSRLPRVVEEIHDCLRECITSYRQAFGNESADIHFTESPIHVEVNELRGGTWQQAARIEVAPAPERLGVVVDRGAEPLLIELGVLPGGKISYRDRDQYLSLEELTRRILDRVLFPRLPE